MDETREPKPAKKLSCIKPSAHLFARVRHRLILTYRPTLDGVSIPRCRALLLGMATRLGFEAAQSQNEFRQRDGTVNGLEVLR